MVEAAATGLRLIARRHTAYTAYLDDAGPSCSGPPAPAGGTGPGLQRLFEGVLVGARRGRGGRRHPARRRGRGRRSAPARDRVVPALSWDSATDRLLVTLKELER